MSFWSPRVPSVFFERGEHPLRYEGNGDELTRQTWSSWCPQTSKAWRDTLDQVATRVYSQRRTSTRQCFNFSIYPGLTIPAFEAVIGRREEPYRSREYTRNGEKKGTHLQRRDHLPLFLPVRRIVEVLHANERGEPIVERIVWSSGSGAGRMGGYILCIAWNWMAISFHINLEGIMQLT